MTSVIGSTYEDLRVDDVADLHFTRVVQQVHRAFRQVLQDNALPVERKKTTQIYFPGELLTVDKRATNR
jgi:hypothetical protein